MKLAFYCGYSRYNKVKYRERVYIYLDYICFLKKTFYFDCFLTQCTVFVQTEFLQSVRDQL